MRFKKITTGYILRLEQGEEILKSLEDFVLQQSIEGALIEGIGTIYDAELGFYHREKKQYIKKLFKADYEVVNLSGNMSYFEEKPVVHLHVTISGEDFAAYSGHLFSARTAATVELFLLTQEQKLRREFDAAQGLNLLVP